MRSLPQPTRTILMAIVSIVWGQYAQNAAQEAAPPTMEEAWRLVVFVVSLPLLFWVLGIGLDMLYTAWYRRLPFSDEE